MVPNQVIAIFYWKIRYTYKKHIVSILMNTNILSLQSISKQFMQFQVLRSITQSFEQCSTYAITGFSGSGKSTLLHIIAGLELPSQGMVFYNNQNLNLFSLKEKEQFFNTKIGLIFQLPYLIDELTVIENVMCKGFIAGLLYDDCYQKAVCLLNELGIAEKSSDFPRSLSGGQQQRVAIARALLTQPSFLLADEPTGNLDETTGKLILEILVRYHKEYNMGLIISSHDRYVIQKMDTILVLNNGFLSEAVKEKQNG